MSAKPTSESPPTLPLSGSFLGALVGSLFLAWLGADRASEVLPRAGLLLPFVLGVSLVGALLGLIFLRLFRLLLTEDGRGSRLLRLRVLLSGPCVFLSTLLLALLAVPLLEAFSGRSQVGGMLLAALAILLFSSSAWCATAFATFLCKRKGEMPSLVWVFLVGVALPLLGTALLIALGNPSGQGAPLALFGVLRRAELDLAPVFEATAIGFLALVGAWIPLKPALKNYARGGAFLILCLSLFGLSLSSNLSVRAAAMMERKGGLTPFGLKIGRALSDTDGDGYSAFFGGGDCAPQNSSIFPGAMDIPENGIDEDCSGSDRLSHKPAAPASQPQAQEAKKLPESLNFLLLTIDTLRFDLGYMIPQKGKSRSPRLDELSKRSTVFTHAYALASYTSKSLGPALIGRYPSEVPRTFEHFDRFSPSVPFVQERLKKAGFETVSVQGYWYFFFKGYGFERGFDVLDSSAAPKVVTIEGDKSKNGDRVADVAIRELTRLAQTQSRFYFWAHWVDPHYEYVRHEDFDYGADERSRYDSEVSFVDQQVGRVLAALEELDLSKKTVVLVTSDHGEAFGEHGMIRHGFEVWEELVRVPLLLFVPGVPPRRVTQRRSLMDLVPTVLETFGVTPEGEEDFVRGTSLYADVLAPLDKELESRTVFVDMVQGPHNQERRAFYKGDHKLITSLGRPLGLYNLAEDPDEKADLSAEEALLEGMLRDMNTFTDSLSPVLPQK